MAYKIRYSKEIFKRFNSNSLNKTKSRCTLDAEFNFWHETSPNQRGRVRERIDELLKDNGKHFQEYISEEYVNKSNYFVWEGFFHRRKLTFGVYIWNLNENIEPEKILNWNEINNFVLLSK